MSGSIGPHPVTVRQPARLGRSGRSLLLAGLLAGIAATAPAASLLPPSAPHALAAPASGAGGPLVADALRRVRGIDPEDPAVWEELRSLVTTADLIPEPGEESVVAVTIGRDDGFCAVYTLHSGVARLAAVVEDLAAIESVEAVDWLGRAEQQLLVVDLYDEMFGAFYRATRWVLIAWNPRSAAMEVVWSHPRRSEQYSLDPPLARRRIDEASAEFLGKTIVVTTHTEVASRRGPGEYRSDEERSSITVFSWDEDAFRFVPVR
ncbi:MAG TPA: hypothetical protein VF234_09970 [Limnochordia bacterium]